MPLTIFSIITPQQKTTTGRHRDCEERRRHCSHVFLRSPVFPVVKQIYFRAQLYGVYSGLIFSIVISQGQRVCQQPGWLISLGFLTAFSQKAARRRREGGTICLSVGTISDNSYY